MFLFVKMSDIFRLLTNIDNCVIIVLGGAKHERDPELDVCEKYNHNFACFVCRVFGIHLPGAVRRDDAQLLHHGCNVLFFAPATEGSENN